MKKGSSAKRYAKALIDIAIADKAVEKTGKELSSVAAAFAEGTELMKVVLNPMYKMEDRKAVASEVCVKVGTSDTIKRFTVLLVETGVIKYIDDVAASYTKFEDEVSGRLRVTVEAASELSPATLDAVKAKLKAETKKDIILTFKKDAAIIGGLVVKVGNLTLDASIKSQLSKIREKLLEGVA
ncbi:MAG: ATP synthase F1 subunit delta [Deltaproteobacteria bacterium]|nr:ATP synthase F1 subunit delta [Deltaproteobacteria bacterium]